MGSAAITSPTPTPTADGGSTLESNSVPIVDLRLLSQPELHSLSSTSTFPDPIIRRCEEIQIPQIDRSVFNESAGSRKQTYSRLRLAPPSSSSLSAPRSRTPHLRPTNLTNNENWDPENAENAQIITVIKQLFAPDMNPNELVPVKINYSHEQLASNVVPTGIHKRKRGRPRKDEVVLGYERKRDHTMVEVSVVDVNDNVSEFPSINENVEDRDRGVLNKDGVAVDLMGLRAVDHPFWDEVRRRSEGLGTEEELLGFLNGLDGKWGSTRKKRRIVDASEFGNALPIGWKLLLSVKKKSGRVWLYCRRYISPSGMQFESCKDVSSYLHSLHGVQDTNPDGSAQHNDADKLISVTVADVPTQDETTKNNLASHASSPALSTTSSGNIIIDAGDLAEDKIGKVLLCNKCNLTFCEKDELLHYQSSLHRRNSHKNTVSLTDGVIIKDGKFECQFCHKTFSESHRYNGHIGAHVRYQAKMAGESLPSGMRESVGLVSGGESHVRDTMTKGSPGSDNVGEICNGLNNIRQNICSPQDMDHVGDSKAANGSITEVDEATDSVPEVLFSIPEVLFSSNENKKVSDHAPVNGCAAEIVDDGSSLQERMSVCSPVPSDEKTCAVVDCVIENSASIENPKQDMVLENGLFNSNDMEACDTVANNGNLCHTSNELKIDGENFAVHESIFDFFGSHSGQENDIAIGVKPLSESGDLPCKNIDNIDNKSTSESMSSIDTKLNKESNVSMLAPSINEKTCGFGTSEKGSAEVDRVALNKHEEMQFGNSSVIPSWIESGKYGTEFDGIHKFSNGELSDPFSSSHAALNANSGHDRKLGVCSSFTPTTDKQFFTEENMFSVFSSTLDESKQEPSPFSQHGVSEVSNGGYNVNAIYPTLVNKSKINEPENTRKHDLSLSFGTFHTEQGKYLTESFNIQSAHKTYDDQIRSNVINHNVQGDMKQKSHSGFDFLQSSFSNRAHDFCSSFNMPPPNSDWNRSIESQVENSGQNNLVGFGSSSSQSGQCVISDGSWTTGHENAFQGCFDAASSPQVQSSSCFRTIDPISNKGQEDSSGLSKILSAGRTKPVEYSFMGEQSSNSMPGESKIFSMEEGLDPSFWLGKDALMHNTTSLNNQVTSVCVWCSNVFYHDPVQPGMQTEAIGSMCTSCSSRVGGQFNFL
ncbi:hypothetical protein ACJIZ3_019217 [Penstemon smallii]|uniref:Uncharacterized protein n=1 Tax=Penstemon smallii TaxID=265156 RepID=A0ABD3T125_9LAMI